MPTLETLTEADVNHVLKASSKRKARDYLYRIHQPVRIGERLTAEVSGSRLYEVEIEVDANGIQARCSCPYNWGGYCKHIGGVLLRWLRNPDIFTVRAAPPPNPDQPIEVIDIEPPATLRPPQKPDWLVTPFAARQKSYAQQLSRWLETLRVQDLRQMAQKRGWSVRGIKKAEIIDQIAEQMTAPESIRRAIDNLDAEHRRVFWAMVLLGSDPGTSYDDLERLASSWGQLTGYKQIGTYTGHLDDMGLTMAGGVLGEYPQRIDFIPPPVARFVSPVPDDIMPASPDLRADQPASELQFADPFPLVRAANQLVLMLEQAPPPLRTPQPRPRLEKFHEGLAEWAYDPYELKGFKQQGRLNPAGNLSLAVPPPPPSLPDEIIERLAPIAGDETRLEFILALLTATGLVQPGSPVTVWPEVKESFLQNNELVQRAILARTYLMMANWNELWEMVRNGVDLQLRRDWRYSYYKPIQLQVDLTRLRQKVARVLASLPDGQWISLTALFDLMRRIWPRFERAESNPYYYYNAQQYRPWFLTKADNDAPLTTDDAAWDLAQGNFIRQMLSGPLAWLGLVDLSFEDGLLRQFRLHGLADLFRDRVEAPPAPPHAAAQSRAAATKSPAEAVVIKQGTITVDPSSVSAQAHSYLDKIARLEQATAEGFVYQLDPQAVYEAFEAGLSLDEALDGWQRLLPIPMPNQIRGRLMNWWQTYGRVRIYENVTMIEFADDYGLAEMKAVTSLERYLIAEISPRAVLIPEGIVEFLTTELEKAGYTPRQTEGV